ncbi:hypothetical protein JCM3770_002704 [Rhodotorula araucariae]
MDARIPLSHSAAAGPSRWPDPLDPVDADADPDADPDPDRTANNTYALKRGRSETADTEGDLDATDPEVRTVPPASPARPETRPRLRPLTLARTAPHRIALAQGSPAAPLKVKRKRNRAALSCSACKKRKIKCDRKLPCEACIKRGEQGQCRWEQPKVEPPPQPFALAVEHDQLKQRVAVLEAVLKRLAPAVYDQVGNDMPILPVPPRPTSQKPSSVEDQQDSDGENVEDAALVLEELALHHTLTRMGSRSNKNARPAPAARVSQERTPILAPAAPLPAKSTAVPRASLPPPAQQPQPVDDLAARAMASLLVPPIDARRQLVLDDIYASLPQRKSEIDWMLRNYFERVDWAWHLHHKPTFFAEYDAFCVLRTQNRLSEIDPLWLACFAMTLCLSVNALDAPVSTPLVSIAAADLETLPWRYFECAQGALECGDWTGRPRFRTLQAIVLFAPFFLFAGNRASAERHQTYIGAALRMAQSMGLHKLGADPAAMPLLSAEDELSSGLPPGINTLKREMALRMLSTLLFLDYTSLRIKTGLPPHLVSSALPGNFNDADLSATSIVPPRAADEATDVSLDLVKFRIALEQRKFKEMMEGDLPFNYAAITDIDANYRAILDSLPTELSEGYIPPLGEPLTSLWRRNMAIQSIQSRILRLHRPWMSRGWTVERYAESTRKAIASARSILACQISLNSAPLLKLAFQLLNVQIAVIVLFMSLFHHAGAAAAAQDKHEHEHAHEHERDRGRERERERTRQAETDTADDDLAAIVSTLPWFEKHLASRVPEVRTVARSSLAAFRLLLRAWERRRALARARAGANTGGVGVGGGGGGDVGAGGSAGRGGGESYGRLLRRVGAIVSAASAAGVDPLVAAEAADVDVDDVPAAVALAVSQAGREGGSGRGFVSPAAMYAMAAGSGSGSGSGLGAGMDAGSGAIGLEALLQQHGHGGDGRGHGGWGDGEGIRAVFASEAALGLTDEQPDLHVDFDLAVLEGPEYADPSFSWTSWTALGQFASLGTF